MNTEHLQYLETYEFNIKKRLGSNLDGGYIIGILPKTQNFYDCYLSAGVANEESFSRDFIKHFNMNKNNSFAFDGTIKKYPSKYTKDITFIRKNIGKNKDNHSANLSYFIKTYNDIFLKMDIEGAEYDWLSSLDNNDLMKFKQIAIEFHGINDNSFDCLYSKKVDCFKKISETHYIIHIHGNNCGTKTGNIPNTLEITYIRKNEFIEQPNRNTYLLPTPSLDYPNNKNKKDFDLNFYPFNFNCLSTF
jgi:hypothetical protein